MRTLAAGVGAGVVGVVSGAAGTLVHHAWWGLALALAAALVTLAWLPAGPIRVAFVLGWLVPVVRGSVVLPAGDFLIASDAPGWSFLGGSFVLLVGALLTARSGVARAEDHEFRGSAT